jgi:hypothetical protein
LANKFRGDDENIVEWQERAKLAVVEDNAGADVDVVRVGINGEGSRLSPPDQALLLSPFPPLFLPHPRFHPHQRMIPYNTALSLCHGLHSLGLVVGGSV